MLVHVNRVRRRHFRQARHGHDLTADRHDEFRAGREPHFANRNVEAGGRALGVRIGRERVLRLGDADGQLAEAHLFPRLELILHRLVGGCVVGAVDFLRDGADLLEQRHVVGIEQLQVRLALVADFHNRFGDVRRAFAAHRPVIGHQRLDAKRLALFPDQRDLGIGVGREAIDRDDSRQTEFLDVLDVALKIAHAALERLQVFLLQIAFRDAAVHLERADGRDDHHAIGFQPGLAALDVEEFLRAEVGAEAGLGHHVIRELQRGGRRRHRVAAMRDVGERAAVDEGGRAFERLHEVRRDCVLQQRRHGAVTLQFAGAHRFAITRIADDDVAEAGFQVLKILGEAEDRHHLRRHRDVETGFARITVRDAAERAYDLAQRAVVHVHHAAPRDAARVDAERIAPVDVVVDQRGEQIVRRRDGVEIAREVEVDVLHRDHLRVAAARRAALHAEARPERGLAQRAHRLLADVVQGIGETDGRCRLAFAGRSRRDRRHQNELAILLAAERLDELHRYLGLVVAVGFEVLQRDAELVLRDIRDALRFCGLGDFDVGFR